MVGLTAYYFNPAYNFGENLKNLPAVAQMELQDYLVITLGQKVSSSLHAYKDKQGIFKTLFANSFSDPHIFWRETGRSHLDLYKIIQRYISVPAFSNCWSKGEPNNVDDREDLVKEKKVQETFYRLKINKGRKE